MAIDNSFDLFATMKRFAYEYLKNPTDAYECARRAFVDDDISARAVTTNWPTNPFVLKFRQELIDEYGEDHFLPTKSDVVRELFKIGTEKSHDAKDRVMALNVLANVMGFIEKQVPTSSTNINTTNNKVMVVKDHGSEFDWENKAKLQQARLIKAAKKALTK